MRINVAAPTRWVRRGEGGEIGPPVPRGGVGGSTPWGLVDAARIVARVGPGDRAVAEIATGQEGLITTSQLLCAGLRPGAIRYRRERGRLHAVHRGVFLVGHRSISHVGRTAAAVLACGPTATVSHRSAGSLWEVVPRHDRAAVHISSATHLRPRTGLILHRRRAMEPADIRRRHRLPLTAPAMTLLDLAETEPLPVLQRALNEARVRALIDQRAFDELFDRTNGRAGWGPLRQLFRDERSPDFSLAGGGRLLGTDRYGRADTAAAERARARTRARLLLARPATQRRDRRPGGSRHGSTVRDRP